MRLPCGDFFCLFYLFDLVRKFISHLLPSLGLSHVIFFKAGQYTSLIYGVILSNLFRLHKKPVASEKQQELLICFWAEISPANKAVVSDKPYQQIVIQIYSTNLFRTF